RASGRPLAVFTNGSHAPPETFAAGLREVGLEIANEELLTPLRSVQAHLRSEGRGESPVLLFADDSARDWLVGAGPDGVAGGAWGGGLGRACGGGGVRRARGGGPGGAGRRGAADGELRARVRGGQRADLQPRRDDDGRDLEGKPHAAGDRGQALARGPADDQRA